MAYSKAWNESLPDGSENANTLETIIQDFKIAMRERLEDLIDNWTNDATDPKTFNASKVLAAIATGKLATLAATERAILTRTTGFDIGTGSLTAVQWEVEFFDNATMLDVGGNPTRITIPATGFYLLSAFIPWEGSGTGYRMIGFRKNGAGTILGRDIIDDSVGVGDQQTITSMIYLTAADYVEVVALQNSGGDLNVSNGVDTPAFSALRLA